MKLSDLKQLNESNVLAPWMFKTKEEIQEWLKRRTGWGQVASINPDLTVDVINRDVVLLQTSLNGGKIPVQFNRVKGVFNCTKVGLESLVGSPHHVYQFFCSENKLASFEGSPDFIGGDFTCHSNLFTSFEGFPKYVEGGCYAHNNPKIKNLHNIHKNIGYIGNFLTVPSTVESHILGIMFIKGIRLAYIFGTHGVNPGLTTALNIINKHLPTKDIHAAHEELLDAGLEEFAQL